MLAETFVDVGLCQGDLEKWASGAPGGSLANVLEWVEANLAADRLIDEIGEAGNRISELVASVKAYSHMDRGLGKQPTDLRIGLDNTLRMLGHELKAKKITVERTIPEDLPSVFGYAGELNQVWTNLLDNAIDAAPEGGRIRIEAEKDDGAVAVRIIDNGGGIPEEIRDKIFEPFYTTKPRRRRHRPRPRHRPAHRHATARRADHGRLEAGRDDLHRATSGDAAS